MEEIFVDIKGYEDSYQISNKGTVRSKTRKVVIANGSERIFYAQTIKASWCSSGYLKVCLNRDGIRTTPKVHTLVAKHFVHNSDPEVKVHVNYKDGNRNNVSADNLFWNSVAMSCARGFDKLHKQVAAIDIDTLEVFYFNSIKEAGESFGYDEPHISKILKGKAQFVGTHVFAYAEEADELMERAFQADRAVIGIHLETGEMIEFTSQTEAYKALGGCSPSICNALSGRSKSMKGYKWVWRGDYRKQQMEEAS